MDELQPSHCVHAEGRMLMKMSAELFGRLKEKCEAVLAADRAGLRSRLNTTEWSSKIFENLPGSNLRPLLFELGCTWHSSVKRMNNMAKCSTCNGSGQIRTTATCSTCAGSGRTWPDLKRCGGCGGRGSVPITMVCYTCGGSGQTN